MTGATAAALRLAAALALAATAATGCYRSGPAADPAAPPPRRPVEPETAARRSSPPPPPRSAARPEVAQAIDELSELTERLCACTDKPCADAVQADIMTWSEEVGKREQARPDGPLEPTDEEMREVKEVTERLTRCMMTTTTFSP